MYVYSLRVPKRFKPSSNPAWSSTEKLEVFWTTMKTSSSTYIYVAVWLECALYQDQSSELMSSVIGIRSCTRGLD